MKLSIKHPCKFQNGKPILFNPAEFRKDCQSMEGKQGYLILKKQTNRKPKSLQQLRYYWGVIIPILGEYFGYLRDEMHSALGFKFLVSIKGDSLPYIRSTACAEWTTVEWEEYCSKIRTWAASSFSIYIPLPNEVDLDDLPVYY